MTLKMREQWNFVFFIEILLLSLFTAKSVNSYSNTSSLEANNYEGLYYTHDPVKILHVFNFKSHVYNSNSSWIVEFYSHWCGDCLRFSPLWKTFAKNVQNWKSIVQVAVIDCSYHINIPICREHQVTNYPSIRFFSVNSEPGSLGSVLEEGNDVASIQKILLDQLENEKREGRGQTWPNIIPYSENDLKNIWQIVAGNVNLIILINETPDSIVGTSMILSFHNISVLHIGRVLTSTTESLVLNFLQRNGNETSMSINDPTSDAVEKLINDKLESQGVHIQMKNIVHFNNSDNAVQSISPYQLKILQYAHSAGDVVFQLDLERALRYTLHHEIPISLIIDGEKMEALKNYLNVLASYFPMHTNGTIYLSTLKTGIANRTSITGESFGQLSSEIEKQLSPVFSGKDEWISCQGSLNFYRRYPCGMWTMFHTLTVNFANMNDHMKQQDPAQILKAMHGYIKNFFGCRWCSRHFVKMANENHLFKVKSVDESILWLWRAHNQVNRRLAGDVTEDPEYKKIQYPSTNNCPSCKDGNGNWIERNVLLYLKRKYSSIGINFYGSSLETKKLHYNTSENVSPYLYFNRK